MSRGARHYIASWKWNVFLCRVTSHVLYLCSNRPRLVASWNSPSCCGGSPSFEYSAGRPKSLHAFASLLPMIYNLNYIICDSTKILAMKLALLRSFDIILDIEGIRPILASWRIPWGVTSPNEGPRVTVSNSNGDSSACSSSRSKEVLGYCFLIVLLCLDDVCS